MKNFLYYLFLAASTVAGLTGCSSCMIKAECEKVNWFEHGKNLAMQGKRVTGDQMVEKCKKVEVISESQLDLGFKSGREQYCTPQATYAIGRGGDLFNEDMCDTSQLNALKNRHREGILAYCDVKNAEGAGASGKVYQNVCPKNMEAGFLPLYKKGRIKYLQEVINFNNRSMANLNTKVFSLNSQLASTNSQLYSLPQPTTVRRQEYDNLTKQYVTKEEISDPYSSQRDRLNSEASNLSQEISSARREIETLQNQNQKLEVERNLLSN